MTAEHDAWEDAAVRLESFLGRRGLAQALQKALRQGSSFAKALALAGAPTPIVRYFERTSATEAPAILDEVAEAFGRASLRRRRVQAAAIYPFVLGAMLALVAMLFASGMGPALRAVNVPPSAPPMSGVVPVGLGALAIASGVVLLFALGAAFAFEGPLPGIREAKRERERALVLAGAAALARRGESLVDSFRAAAELVPAGEVRLDALDLSAALQSDASWDRARPLLGELGASLFVAASRHGQGSASLEALSELKEAVVRGQAPRLSFRLEALVASVGGVAVALAAITVFGSYFSVFGRR